MAKKSSYNKMLKKAIFSANPDAAKLRKKKKLQASANKMSNKMTEPERVFFDMMKELEVVVETQKVIGNKIFDFYIPSKNMIIEVDGDYWHANPLIYQSEDLNKIQSRNVKNDKFKDILATGNGFLIERVWEYDLKNNYEQQKKRFKNLLNG